jgi:hypothetical protein
MIFEGQVWAPVAFTRPLSPDFPSDGHKLIRLVEKYWKTPDGLRVELDDWQKCLLIHVLERYPQDYPVPHLRGRLRYRQVVISMGRQNGKSLIGGVLSLYGLLQHVKGPSVIGVATSVEQANVIYQRTAYAVKNEEELTKRLKATGTRGIRLKDGSGEYKCFPAKEEGLQSVPVTLGIADELHLSKAAMWDSIVKGQTAQKDGILIGITTAGDDDSLLLKRLYKQGENAITGGLDTERFGFFLWEAPEGSTIDTPGAVEMANPAVACGRIPIETVRSDARFQPEPDQQRYTLNRFVASINSWLPMSAWWACEKGSIPTTHKDLVFSIERTPGWEFATIQVNAKIEGKLYTQTIASIEKPSLDRLIRVCQDIASKYPATFVVDATSLGSLAKTLTDDKGYEVWKLHSNEVAQASSLTYAKILQRQVIYPEDSGLLNAQMPRAKRKNVGEGWKIQRSESELGVDAVQAMINGLYVAEVKPVRTLQLF